MNADALLERLKGVRRSGSGWQTLCPAHADRNPSLSIDVRDGRILIHCHAGCAQEALLAAMGIEARDLFLDASTSVRRIKTTYDYIDEQGKLLYQVVRFEPKEFRQRRPDGIGGWEWNLKEVRRVLYRLPDVLAGSEVLVVEGEKDAETARRLGLVATCNPSGAGKWHENYSECLRGKQIVIIADADEPGRKHAQQVAVSIEGKVQSLKVLELPGAKDLSELVEKGGTREALLELIRHTAEWRTSESAGRGGFKLTTLGELLNRPQVETDWLWEGRLAAGTVSGAVSKPKVGKSTFARNLALAISRGDPFLGFATSKGLVIYLALEERGEDVAADFRALGATANDEILIHADSVPADGMIAAVDLVRERKPALVVVDPLFRLARIRDENAYAETYTALGPLIDIARSSGTHLLLIHHSGKSAKADPIDSPLGSTALGGVVSTLIVLRRAETHRLIQTVQRLGQDLPETILEFDSNTRSLSPGPEKSEADVQSLSADVLEYLKSVEGAKTEPQITESVEGKTGVKRKALRTLFEQGKISRAGSGRKGDPFKYSFPCSDIYTGTREQESENEAESRINPEKILVPASSSYSNIAPNNQEQGKPFEEGEL
jgi:putative DNA primase/helicase